MQNFKQFLLKENTNTSQFLQGDELEEFIEKFDYLELLPDGEVRCKIETLALSEDMLINGLLQFQFAPARDYFVRAIDIKSLVGSPKLVNNCEINIYRDSPLYSLVGGPETVRNVIRYVDFGGHIKSLDGIASSAYVYRNFFQGINSYHNVHKHIKEIKSVIEITGVVDSNILGFCLIKGDFSIVFGGADDNDLKHAIQIFNNNRKDMLECQEELITNGFKEYAKL